jgi:transposase-like protein
VALWRASGGKRTVRDVAADLNVNTETLRSWIYAAELHSKLFATVGQARLELFRWLTFRNLSSSVRHSRFSCSVTASLVCLGR